MMRMNAESRDDECEQTGANSIIEVIFEDLGIWGCRLTLQNIRCLRKMLSIESISMANYFYGQGNFD